ncbi:MAG TPA: 50S ribosomal protein L1 [Opitutales bacterium]|nr:50S ribosomal protein L1 [Opitutales bacterium]
MKKTSKRYKSALESFDRSKRYPLKEAIDLLLKMPPAKFDESIELSFHMAIDPRQSDQMVRGTVGLPHGSGKPVRVLVFTSTPEAALEAGADYAGLEDYMEKINGGWLEFDVAIATPEAMREVRTIARILGPRGLMPNPRSGTVTDDIASAVKEVKAGRVEFRLDKTANIGVAVGRRSFTAEQVLDNVTTVIEAIGKARPEGAKGRYISSVTISSTMSPGVRIDSSEFSKF